MKVFLLSGYYDWEGSELIGVFESLKDAENAHEFEKSNDRNYDSYDIREVEVGKVLEWGYR